MKYNPGKLKKHQILLASKELNPSLPNTRLMNRSHFLSFLKQYGDIIVKPIYGSGGRGVMQIVSEGNGSYLVHVGKQKKRIVGMIPTYEWIRRKMTEKKYLVQQRIELAKINGKPFDIRVMIQRKKRSRWVVTGMLAKVAGSGFFITNVVESKGKVLPLATAIRQSNIHGNMIIMPKLQQEIQQIALKVAECLQKHYPLRIIGLDLGIDKNGKVWIIEANFAPDKTYFLRLQDKSMYRKIMSFFRS